MKVSMVDAHDLLLDDLELLLREIDEFNTAIGTNKAIDIPQTLDNYLQFAARSGNTVFPWPHVRSLFRTKMLNAIQQFQEPTCPTESFVLERFDVFRLAAPFTVQRLTELILQPTRHYCKKEKFLRGLEKTVLVVSTVEPRSLSNDEDKNGNDNINTSGSSGDGDLVESVPFSRTFSLDRQDIVASPLRSSVVDVISQNIALNVKTESIAVDPVTSSALPTPVDIISSNIVTVSPDVVLSEGVTSSNVVTSFDVLIPDIALTVSSESIILDPTSEAAIGLVSIGPVEVAATTTMECESSTTIAEVTEVSPVSLLQCVSEHDLVAPILHTTEPLPLIDATSVHEDVTSSLVNMDAVKLPIEDSGNTSMDCQSSSVIESEDPSAHLFHCVAVVNPEDPISITPLQPTEASTEDPLIQTKVEAEPAFEVVSASLVNLDAVKEGIEQQSLTPLAMECESAEVAPQLPIVEAKEEFQIVTGTVAAAITVEPKLTEEVAPTVVSEPKLGEVLLNPETEKSSEASEGPVESDASDVGSNVDACNEVKNEAMDESQQP